MNRESVIVIASPSGAAVTAAMLKPLRGSILGGIDLRFFLIALFSVAAHVVLAWLMASAKVQPEKTQNLVSMPERFAKLIVEKPIPKQEAKPAATTEAKGGLEQAQQSTEQQTPENTEQRKQVQRQQARKAVAQRAKRVEQKMRTVGVLGMLTGVGSTARGPAVVDVLGPMAGHRNRSQDLEKALANMQGLQRAGDVATVQQKLIKSKDVSLKQTESIDHLVASLKTASTNTLEKQGSFVIQKPESIEGAGSSSAKRDFKAINKVVIAKKVGINLTYQNRLKSNPGLAGKVTIRFTITADGQVINIEIVDNTTGDEEFVNAIVRKVKYWRFEAIPEGEVTVTYPFVFRPS